MVRLGVHLGLTAVGLAVAARHDRLIGDGDVVNGGSHFRAASLLIGVLLVR